MSEDPNTSAEPKPQSPEGEDAHDPQGLVASSEAEPQSTSAETSPMPRSGAAPSQGPAVGERRPSNVDANTCTRSERDAAPQGEQNPDSAHGDSPYRKPIKITYRKLSFRATEKEASEFNSARSLCTLGTIAGVFSVFFGGTVLSVIGLAAALFGRHKMKALSARHPEDARVRKALKHAGLGPVVVCIVALALNLVMLAYVYMHYQDLLASGQASNIFQLPNSGFGGSPFDYSDQAGQGSATNSTWG